MAITPSPFPAFPSASTYTPPIFPGGYYPSPLPFPYTFTSYPAPPPGFVPVPAYEHPPAQAHVPPHPIHLPYSRILTPPPETTTPPASAPPIPNPPSSSDSPYQPLPIPASSETYGELSLLSTIHGQPKLLQHNERGSKTEEDGSMTPRKDCVLQVDKTSSDAHSTLPDYTCLGCNFSKGNGADGASSSDEKLVHKHGPEILSMANNDSNRSFASAPTVQAVAEKSVQAKDASLHRLQREFLNIQARFDQQQAHDQSTFDTIQGELAKLTTMASQLAVSIGKRSTSAHTSTPTTSASSTAFVAPKVFGELPTPRSCPRTYDSPLHYYHGQGTPVQSTFVPDGNGNLTEQHLDAMPQPYDFDNLNRQSIIRADGTKHNYFTLPENYPLELVTPPISSSAVENVCVSAPPSVATQAEGLAPVCCSKTNGTADSEPMLVQHLKLPTTVQDVSDVLKEMPVYDVYEVEQKDSEQLTKYSSKPSKNSSPQVVPGLAFPDNAGVHVSRYIKFKHRQCIPQVLEYASPGCSMGAVLVKHYTWNILFSEEGRAVWDLGASTFLVTPLNNDNNNNDTIGVFNEVVLDIPLAKPPERYGSVDSSTVNVQMRAPPLNVLVVPEGRKEWDPGDTQLHVLFHFLHAHLQLSNLWGLSHSGNSRSNHTSLKLLMQLLCTATTEQKHALEFSLTVAMLPNWSEFTDGQLAYMPQGTSIGCSEWPRNMVIAFSCWFTQFEMAKLQWDPGIALSWYTELDEFTTRSLVSLLHQITNWASTTPNAIRLFEYGYTMDCLSRQCNCLNQHGVQKKYNAKNLLSSYNYLRLQEMDIIFTTFLPP